MAGNLNPNLKDPGIIPSDEVIVSLVGEKIELWTSVLNYASESSKDITGGWRYYNDGKQWLFKLVHKKKTIFWAGIIDNTFRITFYFGDKAEPAIMVSDLPQSIKDGFRTTKRYGSIRAISIMVLEFPDVDNITKLIAIKNKLK